MCIGFVSEWGIAIPETDVLKRCFNSNSDGAGYAYLQEDGTWKVKKGFMDWRDFIDSFKDEEFTEEHTVCGHFRIGTSGRCPSKAGIMGGDAAKCCTHPFPVSDKASELDKIEYEAESIVLHNGVVGRGEHTLSDTQVAIRDYIAPMWSFAQQSNRVAEILGELIDAGALYAGSRWFITHKDDYLFYGDWEQDPDTKIWYTHDGYKAIQSWPNYYGAHGAATSEEEWREAWSQMGMGGSEIYSRSIAQNSMKISYLIGKTAVDYMSGSKWDWDKWDDWTYNREECPKSVDNVVSLEDKIVEKKEEKGDTEIYSKDGRQLMALVDPQGNVIWDDIIDDTDDDKKELSSSETYTCSDCGVILVDEDLDQGRCPYCNSVIVYVSSTDSSCPNCGEINHLSISSFNVGDSECYRCGAVFLDTVVGKEAIVMYNPDTQKRHNDLIEAASALGPLLEEGEADKKDVGIR